MAISFFFILGTQCTAHCRFCANGIAHTKHPTHATFPWRRHNTLILYIYTIYILQNAQTKYHIVQWFCLRQSWICFPLFFNFALLLTVIGAGKKRRTSSTAHRHQTRSTFAGLWLLCIPHYQHKNILILIYYRRCFDGNGGAIRRDCVAVSVNGS